MSPTAQNQDCEDFQEDLFPIIRTQKLEASELQALYGEERDCAPEDQHSEDDEQVSDEYTGGEGVSEFSCLAGQSTHSRGRADTHSHRPAYERSAHTHLSREVFFSNQAYYSRLEELKRAHLRNIADLQRLYLNPVSTGQTDRELDHETEQTDSEQVAPRHGPNANPHQRLTDLDQVEALTDDCVSEEEDDPEWGKQVEKRAEQQPHPALTEPPPQRKWCPFLKNTSFRTPANQQLRLVARAETRRRGSKVTAPEPFHMTLREDDRKLRKVKTRSEVELENERLKKELDELKECGKKFRAAPAPASTHLPLYEVVNMRHSQRPPAKEHVKPQGHYGSIRPQEKPSQGQRLQDKHSPRQHIQDRPSLRYPVQGKRRSVPPLLQQPFSFIERERKKKEKKLQAELDSSLTPREERRVFKARPVPKSLYRHGSPDYQLYGAVCLHSRAQELMQNSAAPHGGLEGNEVIEEEENEEGELLPPQRVWCEKKLGTDNMEKEMERRKNGEREREWSYIHPLHRSSNSRDVLATNKADYISV